MRNLLDSTDLTVQEIDELIALALDIAAKPEKYREALKYKKLATLFYEPSTRTRISFTAAMMELGGNVLGFSDANSSSVNKGETVADTVRVVENFADIIAMRHNKDGAPYEAVQYSKVPIINAGDGGHNHPTQTLTDLLTIFREKATFNGLTIGFCGDLKFGRTVHSLTKALGRYKNVKFVFISPNELKIPAYLKNEVCDKSNCNYLETNSLEEVIPTLDALYMTRVQKERFDTEEEYNRLKDSFILDAEKLKTAKKDMLILHPLPRINEITQEVDNDARACYFKQVQNGKYIRMALIYTLLKWKDEGQKPLAADYKVVEGEKCANPRCISSIENVKPLQKVSENGQKRCYYCDYSN
ncbi:MAG: aspartate carbamoyltransferase [Prevotellaceae bacterium]|jgi:aspartate carbamoyltransferase catalytic subunit|nr:aspartate carbamoyltransferase [Prevotellaceae bacterium]